MHTYAGDTWLLFGVSGRGQTYEPKGKGQMGGNHDGLYTDTPQSRMARFGIFHLYVSSNWHSFVPILL